MNIIKLLICAVFAYLVGNIQTSILISLAKHDDIRTHGSGNAGSTNMVRVYGLKFGLLTFFCDFGKAFIAVAAAKWLIPLIPSSGTDFTQIGVYLSGFCVVLGHNFPVFFGFRGGKGVATSFAAVWAVFGMCNGDFIIPILTTVFGIGMVIITGIVSVGSLTGALAEFITALVIYGAKHDAGACVLALALFLLLFLRHTKNIVRILHGEEKKLFGKKDEKSAEPETEKETETV
ncbi:MAG: glycerol-3-phosphate acyltransferase [Clostridia bacterium]|nr:glycerol-3-phosphate acyltransferase [Clostridia bacterium]